MIDIDIKTDQTSNLLKLSLTYFELMSICQFRVFFCFCDKDIFLNFLLKLDLSALNSIFLFLYLLIKLSSFKHLLLLLKTHLLNNDIGLIKWRFQCKYFVRLLKIFTIVDLFVFLCEGWTLWWSIGVFIGRPASMICLLSLLHYSN